jgi:hypothetical protein
MAGYCTTKAGKIEAFLFAAAAEGCAAARFAATQEGMGFWFVAAAAAIAREIAISYQLSAKDKDSTQ